MKKLNKHFRDNSSKSLAKGKAVFIAFPFVFFIFMNNLFSQKEIKEIKSINLTNKTSDDSIYWDANKNFLAFIEKNYKINPLKVSVINLSNQKVIQYNLPKTIDTLIRNEDNIITDFAVSHDGSLIGILLYEKIIFLDLTKMEFWQIQTYSNERIFYLSNNKFLLVRQYNFHPLSSTEKFVLTVVNCKNKTVESKKVLNYKDIAYTMLVKSFVDVYKNKIIYSESTYPVIYILNDKLEYIDSIYLNLNEFENNIHFKDENEYSFMYNSARDVYLKLKKLDSVNTRIEKVFFSNDTTIMLSVKPPNSGFEKRFIYIVNRVNNKWIITNKYLWQNKEKYENYDKFFNWTNSSKIVIKDNIIYYLAPQYLKKFNNKEKYKVADFLYEKKYTKTNIYLYSLY